ncbi:MAG: HEAT repeat domain-containing protein [Candidatus Aureabacteria bacterium]|nr:HEAT repeat domain-containing protein [Candidatus Auribacterota bacterium]
MKYTLMIAATVILSLSGMLCYGSFFGAEKPTPTIGDSSKEKAVQTEKSALSREQIKDLRKEMMELARSSDEAALSKLGKYATDSDPEIRRSAAVALGKARHKDVFDLLLTLAHDENVTTRSAAVMSIGFQKDARAYDTLIEILEKDESINVRGKAVRALGRLNTDKSREKVIACLKIDRRSLRTDAATALGKTGDKKAIEPLIGALLDPEDEVKNAALKSLEELTGQNNLLDKTQNISKEEVHTAWQEWWGKNKETFAVAKKESAPRVPTRSAKDWLEKYDADKNGSLDEKELQTAIDEMKKGKTREEIKNGTPIKADVIVKKTDGSEVKFADLLKSTTLIYYFSGKCPHCVKAQEFIQELYEDNKDKGIAFLGVAASRDTLEGLNSYLAKAKFAFPVVLDEKKELGIQNRLAGTPTVLLIDKEGKIISSYRGLPDQSKEQLIKRLREITQH